MKRQEFKKYEVLNEIEKAIKDYTYFGMLPDTKLLQINHQCAIYAIHFARKHLQERKIIKCIQKSGCFINTNDFDFTKIDLDFMKKSYKNDNQKINKKSK